MLLAKNIKTCFRRSLNGAYYPKRAKTTMSEEAGKELRSIMSMKEGPEVEDALYKFASKAPSKNSVVHVKSWNEVLTAFHQAGIDDQFIPPLVRVDSSQKPVGLVKEGDVFLYFDFRTDRAKPLAAAFLGIPFEGQVGGLSKETEERKPKVTLVTMTHYDDNFNKSNDLKEAFNPGEPLQDTYVEVIGRLGIRQLICAETEKWRAVTWFKDGRRNLGYEKQGTSKDGLVRTDKHPKFPATVRVVQSRKVGAHIQAPVMRAKEIADLLIEGVQDGVEDIFANFANADMVGHAMTDSKWFDGVIEAITVLDTELGRVVPAALKKGYVVMITGDHGNAEEMFDKKGKANPAHTKNRVPFILLGLTEEERKGAKLHDDITIADMAPCALHLRGIEQPKCWDCKSPLDGSNIKPKKDRLIMRLILDGYGVRDDTNGNAMHEASTKKEKGGDGPLHMFRWMKGEDGALFTRAEASGERCGYPPGEAGTTEFGHVLFDAGRKVHSDISLIDHKIKTGEFFKNKALLEACAQVLETKGCRLHIAGIVSDGKVHSSLEHLEVMMKLFQKQGLKKEVSFHVITDGRDVPGDSSPKFITWLEDKIKHYELGQIDSIWGRGWGKDRDNRWLRIEAAFRSLIEGTAGLHVQLDGPSSNL